MKKRVWSLESNLKKCVFAWILSHPHKLAHISVTLLHKAQLQQNSLHYTSSFKPGVYTYNGIYYTSAKKLLRQNSYHKCQYIY